MYFVQSISQNKYDMANEIDDMSYSLIWHAQLHLILIYIFGNFLKYGNNSYITFNVNLYFWIFF